MPLREGHDQGVISANISKLRSEGFPERQAIAIAMKKAGKARKQAKEAEKVETSDI